MKIYHLLISLFFLTFIVGCAVESLTEKQQEVIGDRTVDADNITISESTPLTSKESETDNVIILVIDGVRNEEAFDDPNHQYIPHIWNDLRPEGTTYTNMYVTTWPVTTPAHLSIATGTRSNICLSGGRTSDRFREFRPTIFEFYRRKYGFPERETLIVSGKSQLSTLDYSLHPLGGETFGANLFFSTGNDTETMKQFYRTVNRDLPSLMLINLKDVDEKGHGFQGADFIDYTNAILTADELAYNLWINIQEHPYYSNKTKLIVTTDHGRSCTNYHIHGGPTHCNRHVFFLAIGPGIKQGYEVDTRRNLIDIAPTIAHIMDFDMPFSEGNVLYEMFDSYEDNRLKKEDVTDNLDISNSYEDSIYPSITSNEGGLHVVWSEKSSDDEEQWFINYIMSSDFGQTWSEPEIIVDTFNYYKENYPENISGYLMPVDERGNSGSGDILLFEKTGTPLYANIKSDDDKLAVAFSGYSVLSFENRKDIFWNTNLIVRLNEEWVEYGFDNNGKIVADIPGITFGEEGVWTSWTNQNKELYMGHSANESILYPSISLPELFDESCQLTGKIYRDSSISADRGFLHLVYGSPNINSGKIYYSRYNESNFSEEQNMKIDDNDNMKITPRIFVKGDNVYVVWSEFIDGVWQIVFAKSVDNGDNFESFQILTQSSNGAWYPDIVVDNDEIVIVWEDYRNGAGEIYSVVSYDDGNSWSKVNRITETSSLSSYPSVTMHNGVMYVVWQEYVGGNWEIFFDIIEGSFMKKAVYSKI